jgi:hypothetical protein
VLGGGLLQPVQRTIRIAQCRIEDCDVDAIDVAGASRLLQISNDLARGVGLPLMRFAYRPLNTIARPCRGDALSGYDEPGRMQPLTRSRVSP